MFLAELANETSLQMDYLICACEDLEIDPKADLTKDQGEKVVRQVRIMLAPLSPKIQFQQNFINKGQFLAVSEVLMPTSGNQPGLKAATVMHGNETNIKVYQGTMNCGKTAGFVLNGLKRLAKIKIVADVSLEVLVKSLASPCHSHCVWDITIHQHSFMLERRPSADSNLIVQSYQEAYNAWFWLDMPNSWVSEKCQGLVKVRDKWNKPSDNNLSLLADLFLQIREAAAQGGDIWKKMPFNEFDAWVRPEKVIFTINLIEFIEPVSEFICVDALLSEVKNIRDL